MLRLFHASEWEKLQKTLSSRYMSWNLGYSLSCPRALEAPLTRSGLHGLIALRTGHGDFAWYHRKFGNHEAKLTCSCGEAKAPNYIFFCRNSLRNFSAWPWPDQWQKKFPRQSQDKLRDPLSRPA